MENEIDFQDNITKLDIDYKSAEKVMRVHHLKKSFGTNEVLKDINFDLYKNETLGILGKSGSGKSVIIKSLVRLIEPDAGEVLVFGKDATQLNATDLDEVRLKIGFLFQSGALYDSMTVKENLEFALKRHRRNMTEDEREDKVRTTLASVGLEEAIDKMPAELSGGMRKRVSLARTLILDPEIMLYDEPTTGLDTKTSHDISELLLEMQHNIQISSIVITHDMPCAKLTTNRLLILKEGLIVAEGTYDELANSSDDFVRSFFQI